MVVHRQYLASSYHRGRYCVIGPSTADEAAFLGRAERERESSSQVLNYVKAIYLGKLPPVYCLDYLWTLANTWRGIVGSMRLDSFPFFNFGASTGSTTLAGTQRLIRF